MRLRRLAHGLLLVLLAAPLANPLVTPLAADETTDLLREYTRRVVADWEVPGLAIAVVKDGETVFAEGYGVTTLGGAEAVDADTLFAIGSTTKAMTAALLGTAVDAGNLDWDDRVVDHLPAFRLHDPWVTRELTVRDLLTHRAGLGNADLLWYGAARSRAEIVEKLALVEPAYSMRDGFIYQNVMYIVAGELAAAIGGTTWEELLATRLFEPLGMTRTRPTLGQTATLSNVARPHDEVPDGAGGERLAVIENASVDAAGPAGSVWSSVSDMSRWIRMLLAEGAVGERRVLSQDTVAELFEPQAFVDIATYYPAVEIIDPRWMTYGLGWFQLDYRGHAVQFHTGSIDGMAAIVGLVPEQDLGVVVLENRDHAECRHALMWKVIDLWAGDLEGRDWSAELRELYAGVAEREEEARREQLAGRVEGTTPSLAPEAYAGSYTSPLYDTAEVLHVDGGLRLEVGPGLSGNLTHWHYDTFALSWDRPWLGDDLVTFEIGPRGEPRRLEALGVVWERLESSP
jgi:CubicO group peptidase (beta-lactamase class C family)